MSIIRTQIATNRLTLDFIKLTDSHFLYQLVNSKGWLRFIGDRKVHSIEDAISYINKIQTTENTYYWVVRKKEGAIPLGVISLLKRVHLEYFDLGFAFLPEFTQKGYAFEAAMSILQMAKEEAKHPVILAIALSSNVRSIKLLTKLGFSLNREMEVDKEKLLIYSH